jgi:hypothetical protein
MCGGFSSFAVDGYQRVLAFGSIGRYSMSLPCAHYLEPTQVPEFNEKLIIPGGSHVLGLDEEGNLYFYGLFRNLTGLVRPLNNTFVPIYLANKKVYVSREKKLAAKKR